MSNTNSYLSEESKDERYSLPKSEKNSKIITPNKTHSNSKITSRKSFGSKKRLSDDNQSSLRKTSNSHRSSKEKNSSLSSSSSKSDNNSESSSRKSSIKNSKASIKSSLYNDSRKNSRSQLPSQKQITYSKKSIKSTNSSKNISLNSLSYEIDKIYSDVESYLHTLKFQPSKSNEKPHINEKINFLESEKEYIRRKNDDDYRLQIKEKSIIEGVIEKRAQNYAESSFNEESKKVDRKDKVTFNPYSTTNPHHHTNPYSNYYREMGKSKGSLYQNAFSTNNKPIFDDELIIEESDEFGRIENKPFLSEKKKLPNLDLNEAIDILLK